MDQSQINALSLFQEGEYEKAIESMAKSTTVSPQEFKKFVGQCNQILAEQYKYLINEALSSRDYIKANSLREEFRQKHGKDAMIESLPIPATRPANVSTTQPVVTTGGNGRTTNNKKIYYIVGGVVALIIIIFLCIKLSSSGDQPVYDESYSDDSPVELIEEETIEYEQPYNSSDGYNSYEKSENNNQENSYTEEYYSDFE